MSVRLHKKQYGYVLTHEQAQKAAYLRDKLGYSTLRHTIKEIVDLGLSMTYISHDVPPLEVIEPLQREYLDLTVPEKERKRTMYCIEVWDRKKWVELHKTATDSKKKLEVEVEDLNRNVSPEEARGVPFKHKYRIKKIKRAVLKEKECISS